MILTCSRIVTIGILLFLALPGYTQSIKGKITDSQKAPIPFAVIYDETTYAGTTSNAEGYYDLKLDAGNHSLVYKAMGYYPERKNVTISGQTEILEIQLRDQPVELKEVIITPGKEDPAYGIMRKVIGLAPYHLNQVKEYKADVYLRGTVHIIKIPKFIAKRTTVNGKSNALKSGDVYLEESVNLVHFQAPDKYDQKVTSIRSTFPWNNSDVNPMGFINSSLYENEIDEFISPLASNAFSFYTYKYEGFFDEGEQVVFKIRVTPKHNSQQLMRGTIYIVDKLWCLHSADVSIKMFFGTLTYKSIYSKVKDNAWLPVSYQFYVDAAIMGIKASYKYASSVKFSQVVLNDKIIAARRIEETEPVQKQTQEVQSKTDLKKQKNQQDLNNLLAKEDLSNRDMVKLASLMAKEAPEDTAKRNTLEIKENERKVTVEKDAVRNDTSYWNTIRPIPLTAIETKIPALIDSTGTQKGDSSNTVVISAKSNQKPKKLDKVTEFITNGKGFWAFDSTLHIRYEGLIGLKKIDFNTVDGFVLRQTFSLEQKIDSFHRLRITPGIAYAFSRQRWMWWTNLSYGYAPMRGGKLSFHIGSESADYNSETGLNSTINSLVSLLFRRNYMKLYQQNQAYLTNQIDLANGLNLLTTVGYRTAQPLDNHSDYSFFYHSDREYSPNLPHNHSDWVDRNLYNEEAFWNAELEFTPQYYYRIRGGSKHYQHSKYPTFFLRNRMAVPGIINSTADYDLLEAGIKQRMEWGMMHAFSWSIKGGIFLNSNRIYTMDDKYYNNQNLPVILSNTDNAFRLLPFYMNSTISDYAEVHLTFTTPYLLVKYLPFLSNKIWCENLHFNYLTSGHEEHYWEVGYSISQIYMVGSIGIFAGFRDAQFKSYGVQAAFDLE